MSLKRWVGVDLGLHGAISDLCSASGNELNIQTMPLIGGQLDKARLYDIIADFKNTNCHIVFEKLGVIFGTSKATAFSMGMQCGILEAYCIALNLPYSCIPPKLWQKEMLVGVDEIKKVGKTSRDTKSMATIAVKRLFPGVKLTIGDRATKVHDGVVDSILLAAYCKNHY